ncbi:hypothetical protein [Dyadobacter sandarakinus]|uniref:DUF2157 domain-containing protein n=1 Tax=Dyadobacter sandarakinus TaxID=2747268 RepID=A0ABX7ICH0_9BACT|nr:hypothetical protein [Dyadobacter sandarakinus]QRR03418.1 hypothetical protein HWI92_22140 [Dyadobacter sandarakinus]
MELDKKEAEVIGNAIQYWQESARISPELAKELRGSYQLKNSNMDAVAVYSLIAAISCGLLAFGALVIDEKWIELLRKRWGFSETVVGVGFTALAGLFVYLAKRRQNRIGAARSGSETYHIAIVLAVGVAITYWTRSLGGFDGNYALPLFIAAAAYGGIAIFLRSTLLWTVMIIALAGWWGAQTYLWSQGGYRFLGMNYPLRMTFFGLVIWGLSALLAYVRPLAFVREVTYNIGIFLFLLAAWTLSIFGNYDDLAGWKVTRQSHFWFWAASFTLVLAGLIFYAFKYKQDTLRDLSLVFFLLNIYTRYFEYFWDRTNSGIFFALLALSFWFVARKAEKWRRAEQAASAGTQ